MYLFYLIMTPEEQGYMYPEKPVDYSPEAIAERCLKDIEPYFENALKENNMKKEEQDKLWAELSEENKAHYQEQYIEQKTMPESGVPKLLEELFGEHNLQPSLTYEDIARELFEGKNVYYGIANGEVQMESNCRLHLTDYDLCTSEKQVLKNQAINKLLNVAKFLNKNEDGSDWVPDWENNTEPKWYFCVLPGKKPIPCFTVQNNSCLAYFRTEELAIQAIQILGEDVVRTASTTDY